MRKLVKDNPGFFAGLLSIITVLSLIILAFEKNIEIGGKIFLVVVLLSLLWWISPRLIDLMTDIVIPKTLRGRKIYVDVENGYKMLRLATDLALYLAEKGAIIVEGGLAEFRIILKPDPINPSALSFTMIDLAGYREVHQESFYHWPRQTALKIGTFIRKSAAW
jgi:hypothetical protein